MEQRFQGGLFSAAAETCQNGGFPMANKRLYRQVARMSFVEGLTNQQIAKRLAGEGTLTSPNTKKVAQLLMEAGRWLLQREDWLTMVERDTQNWELSDKLLDTYRCLARVIVVKRWPTDTDHDWAPMRKPTVVTEAADYIDDFAHGAGVRGDALHIATSGGSAILDVVSQLLPESRTQIHFHAAALIGRGRMLGASHPSPETNASIAWMRSGSYPGHLHYATVAPPEIAIAKGVETAKRYEKICNGLRSEAEYLAEQKAVQSVLADLADIDMLVTSFGLVGDLIKAYGMDVGLSRTQTIVGDINYCGFDRDGNGSPDQEAALFLTAGYPNGVEFLRQMVLAGKRVVAVAFPKDIDPLRVALEHALLNVLVAGEDTVSALIG